MQLSVRDVARILKVPEKTIYRSIKQGELSASKINGQYRLNRTAVLEWASSRKLETPPELFPELSDDADLGIGDALREGGVFHDVAGTDKSGALEAVVRTVHLPDHFDRDFLLGVLLAREGLGSTAIGDGIAIPHPRHPIVLPVSRPLVSLCFLATPVEFGAPDGKLTHALFLVISPTIRLHLHLLSRLTFALNDAGFKAAIERHAPASEIIAQARRVDALVERR